jgi:hypothetical protein
MEALETFGCSFELGSFPTSLFQCSPQNRTAGTANPGRQYMLIVVLFTIKADGDGPRDQHSPIERFHLRLTSSPLHLA